MSDPNNPAAPARTRPGSVTISSYLMFVVALTFVLGAVVSLSTLGAVRDVYRDVYAGTSMEGTEGVITGVGAAVAVVQLLFAAAFVVLALLNNQGRNASRIITWVLGAFGLCCVGINFGSSVVNSMNPGSTGVDGPSPAELSNRLNEALPAWAEPVGATANVIALLALLGAVVLLALPPSNEYFRKPRPGWEPPVPGAAYPGYPQGPQGTDPGYPQGPPPGYPQGPPPGYPPAPPPSGDPGYPPVPPSEPPAPPTR